MGDAYTAVGTDFEAVYYNPAGIARRTKPRLKFIDLEGNISKGFVSLFDGSLTKFLSIQKILEDTQKNAGSPYGIGLAVLPQFLVRNFSLGVILRFQNDATYNSSTELTNLYSAADLGAYMHYGIALGGGVFKLGVGGKILNRAELDRNYTNAEIAGGGLSFADQWKEGLGLGYDVGALLTLPVASLPTFGLTVMDVGGTMFQDKRVIFASDAAPEGAPETLGQKINAGYSMILKQGRGIRTVLALDYKDVLGAKTIHGGFEFNYANMLYLRGGVNQSRYWTAGLGVHLGGMGLEFGTYGENLASAGAARINDRKYTGRLLFLF